MASIHTKGLQKGRHRTVGLRQRSRRRGHATTSARAHTIDVRGRQRHLGTKVAERTYRTPRAVHPCAWQADEGCRRAWQRQTLARAARAPHGRKFRAIGGVCVLARTAWYARTGPRRLLIVTWPTKATGGRARTRCNTAWRTHTAARGIDGRRRARTTVCAGSIRKVWQRRCVHATACAHMTSGATHDLCHCVLIAWKTVQQRCGACCAPISIEWARNVIVSHNAAAVVASKASGGRREARGAICPGAWRARLRQNHPKTANKK